MSKNEKVTENKEQKEQTEQKVMTKYDRKVQKRKEEKEKEKKEERISTTVGIVFLVALVCLVASFPIRTYLATHETYVVINGEEVNKVECVKGYAKHEKQLLENITKQRTEYAKNQNLKKAGELNKHNAR